MTLGKVCEPCGIVHPADKKHVCSPEAPELPSEKQFLMYTRSDD